MSTKLKLMSIILVVAMFLSGCGSTNATLEEGNDTPSMTHEVAEGASEAPPVDHMDEGPAEGSSEGMSRNEYGFYPGSYIGENGMSIMLPDGTEDTEVWDYADMIYDTYPEPSMTEFQEYYESRGVDTESFLSTAGSIPDVYAYNMMQQAKFENSYAETELDGSYFAYNTDSVWLEEFRANVDASMENRTANNYIEFSYNEFSDTIQADGRTSYTDAQPFTMPYSAYEVPQGTYKVRIEDNDYAETGDFYNIFLYFDKYDSYTCKANYQNDFYVSIPVQYAIYKRYTLFGEVNEGWTGMEGQVTGQWYTENEDGIAQDGAVFPLVGTISIPGGDSGFRKGAVPTYELEWISNEQIPFEELANYIDAG